MWTTSLTRTERFAIVLALALLLPALAFASKDDDYNKAVQAVAANKVYDAAKYYCAVANADPSYKDASLNCKIYSNQVKREDVRNEERWQNGQKAMAANDFATAQQEFHNITGGVRYAPAQLALKNIQDAIRANQNQEAEMASKVKQGIDAFNRSDFNAAQTLLSQVTGAHQPEAQPYLAKIKSYQQAMLEGDTLAAQRNYKDAQTAYADAARIKPDGPGDPRGKITDMQRLAAQATSQPSGGNTGTQVATTVTPPPPVSQPKVIESKHTVDSARVIRDAQSAARKGDVATARQKLKTVLVLDPGNAQAKAALDALPTENPVQQQAEAQKPAPKAGSEADAILARGITEFYKGDYDAAEVHLKDYCELNGEKSALGYFYIAASKLTRYYLGGEKDSDKKLLNDAEANFRLAKKADGFKPPEHFVSPRIMKVFQGV